MSTTTTYDVLTRYSVQDRSSGPMLNMGSAANRAHTDFARAEKSAGLLGSTLGRVGMVIAGVFGAQQAKKSLLDFNSGMEQAQIQMAGLMEQAGSGKFTSNLEKSATLVRQMQLDARASVGTTKDFVAMASMLVQPITMAGGSMEDLRDMTKQSVVASMSMGIAADVAARDVDQAIRGQYKTVDQFSGKLLTPMGFGGEEGRRKFNAMDMQKRMETYKKALGSPAIAAMAKAQEGSFEGQMSTMVDNIQMTLGKVGTPLFKSVTKELKSWNDWLDKNQKTVEQVGRQVGNTILSAFRELKSITAFIAPHWKEIGAILIGSKISGAVNGLGRTMAEVISSFNKVKNIGMVGGAAGGLPGIIGSFGTALGAATIGLGAFYMATSMFADWVNGMHDKKVERLASAGVGTMSDSLQRVQNLQMLSDFNADEKKKKAEQSRILFAQLNTAGLVSGNGLNRVGFERALRETGQDQGVWKKALNLSPGSGTYELVDAMSRVVAEAIKNREANGPIMSVGTPAGSDPKLKTPEKPKINVTINRIEVASEDPDRWAFNFVDALRDAVRNPSGASASIRTLANRGG